jgi:hypothetical protein
MARVRQGHDRTLPADLWALLSLVSSIMAEEGGAVGDPGIFTPKPTFVHYIRRGGGSHQHTPHLEPPHYPLL